SYIIRYEELVYSLLLLYLIYLRNAIFLRNLRQLMNLNGTYPLRGSSVKLDPIRAIGLDGLSDLPA
ncbi:hypothetical protein, partial [Microcoleus sp. Pol17_C1]|uniref:hypothetical protein n=1 Tax=unclassified Microcoleus TaxID=2642155 RepID=UPI002FCEEEF3